MPSSIMIIGKYFLRVTSLTNEEFLMVILQCSRKCGNGIRRRNVECKSTEQQRTLEDSACAFKTKPFVQEDCKLRECHPDAKWRKSLWGKV